MPPSRRRRAPSGARESDPSSRPAADEDASSESRDHYNYQEMVDHLRKVRSSTADQGLKSKKKRRRRSNQPIRDKRKRRLIALGAFLVVILPIAAFVLGSYLFSYMSYKGETFRKEMSASVSETFGIQGEFEDTFTISRLAMKNRKFRAVGPENSPLAAFDLTNLEAHLKTSSLVSEDWTISHLIADRAELQLRPVPAKTAHDATPARQIVEDTVKILAAGLGFSGVPDTYNAERVSFRHLNANFGANPDQVHRIEGMHVTMNRTQLGYLMNIDKGIINYFYWPEFEVEGADLTLKPDGTLVIHQATLVTEEGGTAAITGEIHFGADPSISVSIEVTNLKVDNMVNQKTWGNRLLGRMDGEFTLEGGLTMDNLPVLKGKIRVPGLSVKNLPILSSLEKNCGKSELKRIEFTLFEAQILQKGSTIRIYDIFGSKPDLAGLTGEFTVQPNHNIDGAFEIGLPNSTLDAMGEEGAKIGRPVFFKSKGDGSPYGWAAFSVTGDLETPIDNLDRQFETYRKGDYNPREHRRATTFQRPHNLIDGPPDVYSARLNQLFEHFTEKTRS